MPARTMPMSGSTPYASSSRQNRRAFFYGRTAPGRHRGVPLSRRWGRGGGARTRRRIATRRTEGRRSGRRRTGGRGRRGGRVQERHRRLDGGRPPARHLTSTRSSAVTWQPPASASPPSWASSCCARAPWGSAPRCPTPVSSCTSPWASSRARRPTSRSGTTRTASSGSNDRRTAPSSTASATACRYSALRPGGRRDRVAPAGLGTHHCHCERSGVRNSPTHDGMATILAMPASDAKRERWQP